MVFKLHYDDVFEFEGSSQSPFSDDCDLADPFDISFLDYEIKELKVKLLHDMYFDQIGSRDEQINTTQIHTYQMYNRDQNLNFLGDSTNWNTEQQGVFDEYITGTLELDNASITTNSSFVDEVIGDTIFISAEEVNISGNTTIQSGYICVIQSLLGFRIAPNASFSPKLLLRSKNDFYDVPVFEYLDNSDVATFCNNSSLYQANVAAAAIMTQLQNQQESSSTEILSVMQERGTIQLFPNPARDLLTLRSSHLELSSITIHDLSGRPIKQQILQAHSREAQINLSGIAPGTYIVRVDCGGEVFSEKLVVTR